MTTATTRRAKSDRSEAGTAEAPAREWISTAEAAAILQRSKRAVLRLAHAGHLRMSKPPGLQPLFKRAEVLEFARRYGMDV